jgi:hypothetical protein
MALEKLHGTQLVTWAPPLPQRGFQIIAAGVTSDNTAVAGLSTDGRRYGYVVVNTSQWGVIEGFHQPPVQAGEQFLIYQGGGNGAFTSPPMFNSVSTTTGKSNAGSINQNAPDLFNVYTSTESREAGGGSAAYTLADTAVHTVAAVSQSSAGAWYVYFSPVATVTVQPTSMGIVTVPKPFNPKYLGQIGHVSGINYTYSLPGGPDQLTCLLQVEPSFRTDALNPGRIMTAHRGGSCIWEGQLTEPVPTPTGWQLTGNGVGTYGANFGAWYQPGAGPTAKSNGWFPDGPVDFAIARGMRWVNRGIGSPAGIYVGPLQNPGSLTITDFMNLLCTGGSLIWELVPPTSSANWPPGPWELAVYSLPTDSNGNPLVPGPPQKSQIEIFTAAGWGVNKWKRTDLITAKPRRPPDLFLVNTNPVGRTIVADYNTIILYYQVTGDSTATSTATSVSATFATTFVDNPASVAAHGRMEYYLDISNAGNMTAASAQAIGRNVLAKYIRANFTSAFAVQPGQLLNPGGFPVDLGCNWIGSVVTVQGVSAAQGGEVGLAPLTFIIGQYAYDDDTQTAQVTPYQNVKADIASVVASLYPGKFALGLIVIFIGYTRSHARASEVREPRDRPTIREGHRHCPGILQAQARTQGLGARRGSRVPVRHRIPRGLVCALHG